MRSSKLKEKGSLSALLACSLVIAVALIGATSAFAATDCFGAPDACFAGEDGDQASGVPGTIDWQDIAGSVTPADDPAKGVDTKFSGGDKELQPGGWNFITGNNTPKTDILKGWSQFDGNFLYASFERAKQTGDTFLAFELNQLAAVPRSPGGLPYPQRSTGDVLITYDISTTNVSSIGMCTWKGTSSSGQWLRLDPAQTPVGGSVKTCTRLDKTTQPAAEGNVNWNNPIDPNYLTDFKPIGAGQFGEAAIGLGALGRDFLKDPCGPNGWFWMHSRASESVTSQPKDLLTGNPIASPTCDLTINKKVSLSSDPKSAVAAPSDAPLAASVGDTLHYFLTVSNPGTAALTINVSDDRCDAGTLGGAGDGVGDPLAGHATALYTCTHVVTADDLANTPVVNTACTDGTATLGDHVTTLGIEAGTGAKTICDQAYVDIFRPDQLAKATGTKFLDANANGVHETDPNAGEGPLSGFVFYVDSNTNGVLDAGEPAAVSAADGTWTIAGIRPGSGSIREASDPNFTCTVPGTADACRYDVAFTGGQTTAVGEFGNAPAPQQSVLGSQTPGQSPGEQIVLGKRIVPGTARLIAPTGCTARAFRARVAGTKVAKVIYYLDGHKIKTVTRKNYRGTFAVRIDPSRLKIGVHRLIAKVTFQRGSATKAKTFRLSFQRCPRALRAPRFTG